MQFHRATERDFDAKRRSADKANIGTKFSDLADANRSRATEAGEELAPAPKYINTGDVKSLVS